MTTKQTHTPGLQVGVSQDKSGIKHYEIVLPLADGTFRLMGNAPTLETAQIWVAAPELLEAVNAALCWYSTYTPKGDIPAWVDFCESAIAKAEGR